MPGDREFDVFVSYSRRRDLHAARLLAEFLRSQGYRIWFDEWILQRKVSWVPQDKDELITLLGNAIARCRCVVLFATAMEILPPSVDLELALLTKQAMRSDTGSPVAWNWQWFEFNAAADAIVLYPGRWSHDSVLEELRHRGVAPSQQPIRPSPFRLAMRWLTRRSRVRRQFRQLEQSTQSDNTWMALQVIDLWSDLIMSESGLVALVGCHGSGRTKRAEALSTLWKGRRHAITVTLPAPDDIKEWCSRLENLPDRSFILIDDFGDALLALPWQEWPELLRAIGWSHDGRDRRVLLVITTDQAEEWSKPAGRKGEFLFGGLTVTTHKIRQPDVQDLCKIAKAELGLWVPNGVVWSTHQWSLTSLAETLQDIPITRSLTPLDRSILQGTLLENPAKLLRVLEEIVALARSPGKSDAVVITDETITHVLQKVTGLSGVLMRDRDPVLAVQELSRSWGFQYSDDLRHQIARVRMPSLSWWSCALAVREKALRRDLAANLAELLYGSREAVLLLDYEAKREQILTPGSGGTEALSWILKAVKRFPFWVVCFERLDLAPLQDVYMIRRLFYEEPLGFLEKREAEMLQRYCLILVDSPNTPEVLDWDVAELKPATTAASSSPS